MWSSGVWEHLLHFPLVKAKQPVSPVAPRLSRTISVREHGSWPGVSLERRYNELKEVVVKRLTVTKVIILATLVVAKSEIGRIDLHKDLRSTHSLPSGPATRDTQAP